MEMYLVLHPGSSIIAIAAVLSHRSDITMEVEKDSLISNLKFLAAFAQRLKHRARFLQSSLLSLAPSMTASE